jgi:proteic killer suppression protein
MVVLTPGVKMSRREVIDITWANRKMAKICEGDRSGKRHWGDENWRLLKRRLASLQAAPTLADMDGVPGNCHQLSADRSGEFALYLWGPYRLIFVPAHATLPTLEDGGIDRVRVTQIEIRGVVDYHGK